MTHGGTRSSHASDTQERGCEHDGGFDQDQNHSRASFLALRINASISSSSDFVSFALEESRKAATAAVADPSKNVFSKRSMEDGFAASRSTAARNTYRSPSHT